MARGPIGQPDLGNIDSDGGGELSSFAGPEGTDLSSLKDTQLEAETNVSTEEVVSGEASPSGGDATDPGSSTTFSNDINVNAKPTAETDPETGQPDTQPSGPNAGQTQQTDGSDSPDQTTTATSGGLTDVRRLHLRDGTTITTTESQLERFGGPENLATRVVESQRRLTESIAEYSSSGGSGGGFGGGGGAGGPQQNQGGGGGPSLGLLAAAGAAVVGFIALT
jgi:hypothetical protein